MFNNEKGFRDSTLYPLLICLVGLLRLSDQIEMNGEYLTNFITIHHCQYLEEKYFGKKRSMDLERVHLMLSVPIECLPFPNICVLIHLLKENFKALKCVCSDDKRLEPSTHNWLIALICNNSCLPLLFFLHNRLLDACHAWIPLTFTFTSYLCVKIY